MQSSLLFAVLVCRTLALLKSPEHKAVTPVLVSIYYETHCPSSAKFLSEQFYPTYKSLQRYIDADLVPYGKARHRKYDHSSYEFTCHHGPNECKGNMIHTCALRYFPSFIKSIKFISCTMNVKKGTKYRWKLCARKVNVNYGIIDSCLISAAGPSLLAAMGEKTRMLQPPLRVVPSVAFDNRLSMASQDIIENNFKYLLCSQIAQYQEEPDECNSMVPGRRSLQENSGGTLRIKTIFLLFSVMIAAALKGPVTLRSP